MVVEIEDDTASVVESTTEVGTLAMMVVETDAAAVDLTRGRQRLVVAPRPEVARRTTERRVAENFMVRSRW